MKRLSLQATKSFRQQHSNKSAISNLWLTLKRYKSYDNASCANFPRKVFSGIQPSGALHLGNYLGAVQNWIKLQNEKENVTFCIVDMHSITVPQSPPQLRENIFEMAATLLACDVNPDESTIFVQSTLTEHTELCWILNCLSTMARLGQLPQFKDKAKTSKDVPLGIFVYPILQAADILLHKATHVPVGEDQLQHIQLAQHLAKLFNNRYGVTFPNCQVLLGNPQGSRIRSLRNPSKKMSKSDADTRAAIYIRDEPDVIVDKIKKAVTDFISDVTYDPSLRPGVSNLIAIHSLVSGIPIKNIVEEAKTIDTGTYKMRVAEAVVEHLRPMRAKIEYHLSRRTDLINILQRGTDRARDQAEQTIAEVKQKMGLGISGIMPAELQKSADIDMEAETAAQAAAKKENAPVEEVREKPVVPKQKVRLEKKHMPSFERLAPQFETSDNLLPLKRPLPTAQQSVTNNNAALPTGVAVSNHGNSQIQLHILPTGEVKSEIMTTSESENNNT